jgi:hypothetical protein
MPAKFPGKCKACGFKFPVGEWIKFDPASRTAVHRKCPEPSYDGTEQKNIFENWIKTVEQADKEAEERMSIPPSPHLSQPDEDMEDERRKE